MVWCYTDAKQIICPETDAGERCIGKGRHAERIGNRIITKSNQTACCGCDGAGSRGHGTVPAVDNPAHHWAACISGVFLLHLGGQPTHTPSMAISVAVVWDGTAVCSGLLCVYPNVLWQHTDHIFAFALCFVCVSVLADLLDEREDDSTAERHWCHVGLRGWHLADLSLGDH